jgi:hypothetical protein
MIAKQQTLHHITLIGFFHAHAQRFGFRCDHQNQQAFTASHEKNKSVNNCLQYIDPTTPPTFSDENLIDIKQTITAIHNCFLNGYVETYVFRFTHFIVHYLTRYLLRSFVVIRDFFLKRGVWIGKARYQEIPNSTQKT